MSDAIILDFGEQVSNRGFEGSNWINTNNPIICFNNFFEGCFIFVNIFQYSVLAIKIGVF